MEAMKAYNSKKNPYIVKCYEFSTAHISLTDNQCLQRDALTHEPDFNPSLVVYPYEYGYFIFVAVEEDEAPVFFRSLEREGYSLEFLALVKLARDAGCKYMQLDSDGVEYEDLPIKQ